MNSQQPSCENCSGACCGDIHMILYGSELMFLLDHGADMRDSSGMYATEESAKLVGQGTSMFYLMGACPFLKDTQCSIFDSLDRPGCCSGFEVGCNACKRRFDPIG